MKLLLKKTLFFTLVLFMSNVFSASAVSQIKAQLLYEVAVGLGEGAIWHPQRQTLFWVDITGKTLYEYLPKEKKCNTWYFDRMVSTVVPETKTSVIVSLQNEIVRIDLTNGITSSVAHIPDQAGKFRCNDGKCDPQGRLWVGTMSLKGGKEQAKLFCVTKDGSVTKKLDGITISNGLVWTADRKLMYYIDTPTRKVVRFAYDDASGNITPDGVAVHIPPNTGSPDGMAIDAAGNLWVAQWGGYGVYCYDPTDGRLLSKIKLPVPNVTSCAFGGKNLDTLYITTAHTKDHPQSGSLFVCKPGVKGVRAAYFK